MKKNSLFLFFLIFLFVGCKNEKSQDLNGNNHVKQDSSKIEDPEIQNTIKELGIEVKNEMPAETKKKVEEIIEKKKEESFLKDLSPEEAIGLYEEFAKKYNPKNKEHKNELMKWTNDRFHQEWNKKLDWYLERKEKADEVMQKK